MTGKAGRVAGKQALITGAAGGLGERAGGMRRAGGRWPEQDGRTGRAHETGRDGGSDGGLHEADGVCDGRAVCGRSVWY